MTGAEPKATQRQLQLTNAQMCKRLGVAETTWCNWTAGRIKVPITAVLAMRYLLLKNNRH